MERAIITISDNGKVDIPSGNVWMSEMSNNTSKTWNSDIINMICAYFEDMQFLFSAFSKKMRKGGVIYFNN